MTQTNTNDPLSQFVSRLVAEKGLSNCDPEVLAQVKLDLLDRVEDRINAAIVANLPVDKLEYFEKLVDRADEAEIQAFCSRNIQGFDEIIAKELVEFRKTYLNLQ